MSDSYKKPPYSITSYILTKIEEIGRELGYLELANISGKEIQLRKENKIKTIQSNLSIEGNTLNFEEIRTLLDGKKIIGPAKDIIEVKNAIEVYKNLKKWNGIEQSSFLEAHEKMMEGLITDNGQWRKSGVGIYKGDEVRHMGPPAHLVESLMSNLFKFLREDSDPWLIKATVFHYELEFIHPFSDGNGRMGRLWQQILLMSDAPIFEFIPVEEIIKRHQSEYYQALENCDAKANSTEFIEYALDKILIALQEVPKYRKIKLSSHERVLIGKEEFAARSFTRKSYATFFGLSGATASRDLALGVEKGVLLKKGDKSTSSYQYQ